MNTRLSYLSVLFFVINVARAQEVPELIPPTPTAYSLTRYGDTPISLYNGTPQINIPIWTATEGDITLPISLSYRASGIKVEETASWVGLGWALNAGGVITRSIKGQPETYMHGPIRKNFPRDLISNELDSFIFSLNSGNFYDTEPDVFNYNFNGYTGQFFFDENRNAVLAEHNDLEIYWETAVNPSDSGSSFRIIEPNGFTYFFDMGENTGFEQTSWYLSRIESPKKNSMTFSYTSEDYITHSRENEYMIYNQAGAIREHENNDVFINHFHGKRLTEINSGTGSWQIAFSEKLESRKDVLGFANDNAKALEKITIFDTNKTIKQFNFETGYFETSDLASSCISFLDDQYYDYSRFRLTLLSLKEISVGTDNESQQYSFGYYGDDDFLLHQLPNRFSASQDHWGYFNSSSNNNLIPKCNFNGVTVGSANRDPHFDAMKAGTLNSIKYPTGGTTEFDMEVNRLNSEMAGYYISDNFPSPYISTPLIIKNPGEISEIKVFDSSVSDESSPFSLLFEIDSDTPLNWDIFDNFKATLVNTTTGTEDLDIEFKYDGSIGAFELEIKITQRINSNFTNVYYFTIWENEEGEYYSTSSGSNLSNYDFVFDKSDYFIEFVLNGETNITAGNSYEMQFQSNQQFESISEDLKDASFYIYNKRLRESSETIDSTNKKLGGGLRIKNRITKDENGDVLSSKFYEYIPSTNSEYFYGTKMLYQNYWSIPLETFEEYGYSPYILAFVEEISLPFSYYFFKLNSKNTVDITNGKIGYETVTVSEVDNGRIVYDYTNQREYPNTYIDDVEDEFIAHTGRAEPSPQIHDNGYLNKYEFPYAPKTDYEWKRGKLLLKSNYNENGDLVKQIENQYNFIDLALIEGNAIVFNSIPDELTGNGSYLSYVANTYHLSSGWSFINKTIETNYDNFGNSITTTKTFKHNSADHTQLTETTFATSKEEETITTKYSYPSDYPVGTGISTTILEQMVDVNILNPVIKEETTLGGNIISTKVNTFENWDVDNDNISDDIFLPQFVKTAKGSNILENRLVYHKYDKNGNPQEVSKADGTHIIYIWGYNQSQPIAKIENATASVVDAAIARLSEENNTLEKIQSLSDMDFDNCIGNTGCSESNLRKALGELQAELSDSQMSYYTYNPLIGMTSMTDSRGQTIYYEYDNFNRLETVKDADGHILNKNEYHYKN